MATPSTSRPAGRRLARDLTRLGGGMPGGASTGQPGTFPGLLTSRAADDFLGQVGTLQEIASHQTEVLGRANAAGTAAAAAQDGAAKALAKAQATYQAVAAQQAK